MIRMIRCQTFIPLFFWDSHTGLERFPIWAASSVDTTLESIDFDHLKENWRPLLPCRKKLHLGFLVSSGRYTRRQVPNLTYPQRSLFPPAKVTGTHVLHMDPPTPVPRVGLMTSHTNITLYASNQKVSDPTRDSRFWFQQQQKTRNQAGSILGVYCSYNGIM